MSVFQSGRVKAFVFLAIGIVGGSLAVGPLAPAFAKVFQGQLHVKPDIVFTGNSGQATLKAINNGSGYAIVGQSNTSAAVFGQSVSGGGIVGLSTSGYGLTGTSSTNIGLNGTSTSNDGVGGSNHADFPFAGVFGSSLSPGVNAIGVAGEQGANGYGVAGTCITGATGSCFALTGQTGGQNGTALLVVSMNAAPSVGYTPAPAMSIQQLGGGPVMQINVVATAVPVLAIDGNGTMNLTAANNAIPLIVRSSGVSTDALDVHAGGTGGEADLATAGGTGGAFLGFSTGGGQPALRTFDFNGGPMMIATDFFTCSCDVMSLDNAGNMILLGTLTTTGVPLIRTKTLTGHPVTTYATQQSEPTVEDFGQGQLVEGQAEVRLDPAFVNTMDQRKSYLVFITPDGDSHGLYTTQKTPTGFAVRENGGGRSTLAFDYRIVGKPYGSAAPRLPSAQPVTRISPELLALAQRARYEKTHPNWPRSYPAPKPLVYRH